MNTQAQLPGQRMKHTKDSLAPQIPKNLNLKLPPVQLLNQEGTDEKSSSIETMCAMDT